MSSTLDEPCKIAGDFDESACEFCERYKSSGLSNSSRTLLSLILDDGIQNKSVLDLGCGAGGFSIEALKQGGSSSIGIDLSPKMVETANQLAATNGLEGRAKFQQGNAASASLPPSDIVIMDKVICCYSDIGPLVKNASEATKNLLGFVVPRDDGVLKWPLRLGVWVMNRFEKRRGGLLFYLHRLDTLDRTLRNSGFVRQKKRGSRFWLVFLYKQVQ